MNKLKTLIPATLGGLFVITALASCTVVEPVPATSTTTVQRETTVHTPAATTTTTTTHAAGGY